MLKKAIKRGLKIFFFAARAIGGADQPPLRPPSPAIITPQSLNKKFISIRRGGGKNYFDVIDLPLFYQLVCAKVLCWSAKIVIKGLQLLREYCSTSALFNIFHVWFYANRTIMGKPADMITGYLTTWNRLFSSSTQHKV